MQKIVAANDFCLRIRQECVGVAKFLSLALINLGSVDTNRDDMNPARFKFWKPVLKTPQLGVA